MAETTQDSSSAKVALWNDPRYRSLFFQLLLVAVVIWLFWSMVDNTITNLQKQNIASGFGFLETTAGFGIITTLIPYSETSSYGRAFVVGLLNTVLVASIGIVFATILGFIVGIARLAPNWVIRKMASAYVETMRNIPLLLQIFFWYFAVLRSVPGPRDSLMVMDALSLIHI